MSNAVHSTAPSDGPGPAGGAARPKRDRTHLLYILIIVAVVAGAILGLVAPGPAKSLKPLGDLFVSLITMLIAPVIFCTIVLGIGSVRQAATVGKAGVLALVYFLLMSTFALAIGLVVGNLIQPGHGLTITPGSGKKYLDEADVEATGGFFGFLATMIPDTLFSSLTADKKVLQALLVALLVGFAIQSLGEKGKSALDFVRVLQQVVFKVLSMVLWVAPIGAFGAIAAVVGGSGASAIGELLKLMGAFYLTCILFIVIVLGGVLWLFTRTNIFRLMKYLGREYLLIVASSSSESALPLLMAKMEHVGVHKSTVGIVVPTGYSFNLDGTAIYLTMAAIFISDAMNQPMGLGEQVLLLAFMILASKGAAGVSGAGIATLGAGLASMKPQLLDGVGVIQGIDRFMSEARALTNFTGNAVATLLVGTWTKSLDRERVNETLRGHHPFDYSTMTDEH